jgi:hypothetical protein
VPPLTRLQTRLSLARALLSFRMPSVQQPSQSHHHTAQHYLRHFSPDNSGEVYVHRREWLTAKRLHTSSTGQQTKLYSLSNPHPEVPVDAIELVLSEEIDGPASAILPRFADGETLARYDRLTFARHLALQSLRTPWAQDQFNKSTEFFTRETFRSFLEHARENPEAASKAIGKPLPPELIEMALEAINSNGVGFKTSKNAWLTTLMRFLLDQQLPEIIASLPWLIVKSHSGSFVTSDNPVVKARIRPPRPGEQRAGWGAPSVETTYALRPDTALVIRADLRDGIGTAAKSWLKNVNHRCMLYANQEFYASSERPGLHAKFRQVKALSIQTELLTNRTGSDVIHTAEHYVEGIAYS